MDTMQIESITKKFKQWNALYVEDDAEVRKQTAKMLSLYFGKVIECKNGTQGIEKFKTNNIDVVFTDINMPMTSGLDMIREIKNLDKHVWIVIFSAHDNPSYFMEAIELGVDGYLLKPFQLEDMLRLIQKIAKNSGCVECLKMIDGFYWDRDTFSLYKEKEKIKLSAKETLLLNLLTASKQRIFSSVEIENEVFNDDVCNNKRVRNLINRFRHKTKSDLVESIYSQGYRLRWQI